MSALMQDIRYAVRVFRRNPAIVAVAVFSLALGIGPNAAIFSVIDALGFRPLSVHDPDGLLRLYTLTAGRHDPTSLGGAMEEVSYDDYEDLRARTEGSLELAAWSLDGVSVGGNGRPAEVAFCSAVSDAFFPLLDVRPVQGRAFLPDEARGLGDPVALISDAYWRKRFDRSPAAVGSVLTVNRADVTIVGVLPADFRGLSLQVSPDLWMPMGMEPGAGRRPTGRARGALGAVARLKESISIEQVTAQLDGLSRELERAYPATNQGRTFGIEREEAGRRRRVAPLAVALLLVPGLVLLVACANVAGLLLGRADARRGEIAVRLALGAGRRRLIRQLLTESAVLALAASAAGLLLGYWFVRLLPALIPPMPMELGIEFRADLRMLAFTVTVACLSVPIFGLAPALFASRANVIPLLKGEAGAGLRLRLHRLAPRSCLVVAQIAVSLALLLVAGLLVRSFRQSRLIDPGFAAGPAAYSRVSPQVAGHDEGGARDFYRRALDRLAATASVESASLAFHVPLDAISGGGATRRVLIPGHPLPPGQDALRIHFNIVDETYLATMRTRIVRGRGFTSADRWPGTGVVLVSQAMAERFWSGKDPVGQWIELVDRPEPERRRCQVVGVVQDGKYASLGDAPRPYLYLPFGQQMSGEMCILVRSRDSETHAVEALRTALVETDPSVPAMRVVTMSEHMRLALMGETIVAIFAAVLGMMALVLAVVGLYGVMAYVVSRRTREIGIRMALGASPSEVLRTLVRQGGIYAALGIAAGVAAGAVVARMLGSLLFGVSAHDPLTYAAASLLVLAVSLLASYLPARRAARIDPMQALRKA